MRAPELSRAAERDVAEIYAWTEAQFGSAQADRYGDALVARMEQVAEQPSLGRSVEGSAEGTLRIALGRHFIYYREIATGIRVLRVLHQRMLQDPQLN